MAGRTTGRRLPGWAQPGWRFLRTAALAAGAAWLCLAYVAQPYRIHGSSMAPTLESGERVLVNKLAAPLSLIGRGDIVVFRDPSDASVVMVKRVIAVSGDTVRFLGNDVSVLPALRDRGSIDAAVTPVANASATGAPLPPEVPGSISVTLDGEEYFLLGDNRGGSSDSRHWGALPRDAIIGEAMLRIFPWGRIGFMNP